MAKEFILSAIHILPLCKSILIKGLKEEWYFLNDRLKINNEDELDVIASKPYLKNYYGKNISVNAIVGVNGCGKSSLLELIYRIINNLSCILNRGKRRKASENLYYIDGLYAELHYIVDGNRAYISCQGDKIYLKIPDREILTFYAFNTPQNTASEVLVKDFISIASSGLFYSIVTNYSMQAFIANDFKDETVYLLKEKLGRIPKEEASWINGLFHKNDGYTTPLVLNPYRDEGKIDMMKEHRLTLYRLVSCFIHAKNNNRDFLRNYTLDGIYYEYNKIIVQDKILAKWDTTEEALWNFKPNNEKLPTYADVILNSYGYTITNLNWQDEIQRMAALYLVHKTLAVAKFYPGYDEFTNFVDAINFFQSSTSESEAFLVKLVNTIKKTKSHETIKIHQTLHFLDFCKNRRNVNKINLYNEFCYDDYVITIGGNYDSKNMGEIQEFLPPSFFTIKIKLNHINGNGKKDNKEPILIERLSSGERQFLYTFSTYIYHILNLLSIQSTSRVRYRRLNLVLDEVEICFHPEYQRRFIDELLGYITRFQLNRNASINIMIATHSPFILSDIMENNILYLKDGRTAIKAKDFRNPFCANISDLLYQSFFLEEGFFGEYSRQKIKDIMCLLQSDRVISASTLSKDYIIKIVESIGDEFLKMHLVQLMRNKGFEL